MKRILYAVLTAIVILSGCEYHPYYDGQKFRVFNSLYGFIEHDTPAIPIPIEGGNPHLLCLYGGYGKHHSVEIYNPEILGCSYDKGFVKNVPFDYPDIETANVTLLPERLGQTSVRVTEEDTGESAVIDVKVCESYHALEISSDNGPFASGTFFALRYGGADNVLRICKGDVTTLDYKHIVDGTYKFVDYDGMLSLEITYPADEEGHPDPEGKDLFRKYLVQAYYGGTYGDNSLMMEYLNLSKLSVATRASFDEMDVYYNNSFRVVDITDGTNPENAEHFYMSSATIIPWVLE